MLGAIQHLVAVVPLFFSQINVIVWLSILWGYCRICGNYRQGLKNLFSCFSVGQTLNQITPWFDSQAIFLNYSRPQRD